MTWETRPENSPAGNNTMKAGDEWKDGIYLRERRQASAILVLILATDAAGSPG
jgi:hypothetical protein